MALNFLSLFEHKHWKNLPEGAAGSGCRVAFRNQVLAESTMGLNSRSLLKSQTWQLPPGEGQLIPCHFPGARSGIIHRGNTELLIIVRKQTLSESAGRVAPGTDKQVTYQSPIQTESTREAEF